MKSGWKTAKFKDVSTVVGGSTPKTDIPEYWGGDNYWVAPAELDGGKYISSTVKRITDLAVSKTTLALLPCGTVLLSSRAPIGKVAITTVPMYCNQGFKNIVCGPELFNGFVYYFLKHNVTYLQSLGTGATFKEISKKVVENVSISFPPIEEQQRIVAELDLLTGIIEKKNAQLRDLDTLAQSIFYEMFGDPVTNEKGWPTAQLSSVSTLLNGRAYKQDELLNAGKYRVLRVGNFFTNSNYYYSDLELEDNKYCDNGDLLFAWSASFGAFIWSGEKVIYHYHIWKVLFDNAKLNKEFYRFLLNTMTSSFLNDVHGIGMVHLTKAGMEQYILPIPPMEKQEDFANKIASIEKQRTVIQASLDGANQLLTSRMSFYFG